MNAHRMLIPAIASLVDEAKKNSWTIVSMKDDWKRIFAFES